MIEYDKDVHERIQINTEQTVVPLAVGGPLGAAQRNSQSFVYVKDGEAFEVVAKVGGTEYLISSGVGKAKVGKMCALMIQLRGLADQDEPAAPAPEIP